MFVDLPEKGTVHNKGDSVCGIESVKTAADVKSPTKLEVVEVNQKLQDEPALINSAAESDGWILKVKINSEREMDDLLSEDEYKKYVDEAKAAH